MGNLGSVTDDEQPQERTPHNLSLLTHIHLSFELSFDWVESVHVLPKHRGSVRTQYLLCVCMFMCPVTVASHLYLI